MAGKIVLCSATALALTLAPARALVGPASVDATFAPHVVMLLKSIGREKAFCSAIVITQNVLLTAAHCAAQAENLRVYWPGADVANLATVSAVAVHPQYRPDAVRTRERSIELAMVRLKAPLPGTFAPVDIDWAPRIETGMTFRIAGFGLARENEDKTSGILRSGLLAARDPLSKILLWARDPNGKGLGACTGDSGGPIFSADGRRLVAITVWSEGEGARKCGSLTQGLIVAPQRGFIEATLRKWQD